MTSADLNIHLSEKMTEITSNGLTKSQSKKWTGSVRRIENPIQSKWIWTGLDCKITYLMDSGLDWIGNLPFPYFILEDELLFS